METKKETTEEMRKRLLAKFNRLKKKATDRNDKIVLTEDGKETDNYYPMWILDEASSNKTPTEWVGGIMFDYAIRKRECHLDFIFKPANN